MHHGINPFHPICAIVFVIGQIAHAWLRASGIVQARTNGISTYRQYFELRAPVLFYRFFGCYLIFAGWQLGLLADFVGLVPGAEALMKAYPHPIPVNVLTAGCFGLLGDAALNRVLILLSKKWPGIVSELPAPDVSPAPVGDAK